MFSEILTLAALAAIGTAQEQTPNLTAALAATPELSQLTTLLSANQALVQALGSAQNITILAPSNEALGKLNSTPAAAAALSDPDVVAATLQYHVLNGTYPSSAITEMPVFVPTLLENPAFTNVTGGQRVEVLKEGEDVLIYSGLLNNATVTTADTNFTGGVIHIIDTLLTVPQNISSTAVAAGLSGVAGALTRADLVTALDTAEDVTVFAPNNSAFQAIGSALGSLSVEDLAGILQYHVVNGTVGYSSDLMNDMQLQTMGGSNVTITINEMDVYVNSAKVLIPNVLVANGVVHVIDNVLNPEATTARPDVAAPTQPPAFEGASSASDLPLTSGVPSASTTIGAAPTPDSEETPPPEGSQPAEAPNAAAPMQTGAIGAAALFAGAGMVWNM